MIIRFIVALAILYLAYRVGKLIFQPPVEQDRQFPQPRGEIAGEDLVRDPQCGTYVPLSAAVKETIGTETQYFCCTECRDRYRDGTKSKH